MPLKGFKGMLSCILLVFIVSETMAQSTAERVYTIFQTSCAFSSCHDNDGPVVGLDLEGSGPNAMMEVYDNIVGVTPSNSFAANKGYKYIEPGDVNRSFLFRKVHDGLEPTISLEPSEGGNMPATGGALDEEDIELIRQWILYGAPSSGEVIDVALIDEFYNNNGIQSVPSPPAPPAEGEGFQIHLGPFFIDGGEEKEVFYKYNPRLEEDIEITAVDVAMGNQSHHFILYKFFGEGETLCGITPGGTSDDFSPGLRGLNEASHASANFLVGAQNPERVDLPYNTAFSWEQETVLDLNSHYINASSQVLSSDVYINVYTQDAGVAAQEMKSIMIPHLDFEIPNDGEEHVLTSNVPLGVCFNQGMYLWATTSHTHQWGIDYDIYKSDVTGAEIDHIFDGSCFVDGVPGCVDEFYDYQHPPTRVFDDYYRLDPPDWVKHEATYINNGPEDVGFGFTSDDEMMLFFFFYVLDTAGLTPPPNTAPLATDDAATTNQGSSVIISVLANDNDNDGELDPTTVDVITGATNGTATVNPDGTITYEPDLGFSGTDVFTYVVCDDGDPVICDTAEVTVTVEAVTGIIDANVKIIRAYPNPTSGLLHLPVNAGNYSSVKVVNLQGQEMLQLEINQSNSEELILNLRNYHLEDGMYWIQLERRDGTLAITNVVLRSAR
jgi:hypothetical protein